MSRGSRRRWLKGRGTRGGLPLVHAKRPVLDIQTLSDQCTLWKQKLTVDQGQHERCQGESAESERRRVGETAVVNGERRLALQAAKVSSAQESLQVKGQ